MLRAHPAIAEAAVVAHAAGSDGARLVAYLVYAPGQDLTASEVRAHLRQSLPDYMLPSVFVALDALPQTPNGKLDRRALPDPFRNAMRLARTHKPPAAGMEETVARIWQEVLQAPRVGAEDNFFELGGNSLLSVRVATAIERETGLLLPPRSLFFQTLRQVAANLVRPEDLTQEKIWPKR